MAWESLVRQAPRLGIPADDLPSYDTVRVWIDSGEIPEPVKILARQGERALNERALPFLLRKYVDVPVNDTWVSDHAIVDMIVRNNLFAGIPENAQMRLRFTCILDFRTRAVVGYCWTPEGSSRSIATAFRNGVYRFGPPCVFLADNGKDFKRFARGASFVWQRVECPQFVDDIRWFDQMGVLARLNVMIQHCMRYAPQGKHIERFFRTMHMRLESLFSHYTTGSAYTRPDATNAAMAEHAKLMRHGR
jgi:transposase InsO family protein